MKNVLTYGTFDTFHYGHLELLIRAAVLGDKLTVGLSTDTFNKIKGKVCKFGFDKRKDWLENISVVDCIIPENDWDQKVTDIKKYKIDTLVMGDDWNGKFDFLKQYCDVLYLTRTKDISTTQIKKLS